MVLGEMVAVSCATRRKSINTPLEGKSEILITEAYGTCTGGCQCVTDISNVLYYITTFVAAVIIRRLRTMSTFSLNNIRSISVHM